MARADLLVSLVRAGSRGDQQLFRRTVEALVAEERAKNHHVLAEQLVKNLVKQGNGVGLHRTKPPNGVDVSSLIAEVAPRRTLEDLVLPEAVQTACAELVEEQQRVELLRSYNLEPRCRIMLVGPPGNGKTSLAEALAEALMIPLYVVRYDGIVGSFLGETAQRLRRVFNFVRMRRCVLFFDEFDTVGKERADEHETGEIKRVVSSLLMQVDELPSHVVVITATNHAELLDRAVWRRFQLRLELPRPSRRQIQVWFERYEKEQGLQLGQRPRTLANKLLGVSFGEVEEFALDVRRRYVLSLPDADIGAITKSRLAAFRARYVQGQGQNGDGG